MPEIRCPHCGKTFQVDESDYAQIVRQVRDSEFSREIGEREKLMERDKQNAVSLAESRTRQASQADLASRDQEIAALKAQVEALRKQADLSVANAVASVEKERDQLKASLAQAKDAARLAEANSKSELASKVAEKQQRIAELEQQAKSAAEVARSAQQAAVVSATAEANNQITELKGSLERAQLETRQVEASLKQEMGEKLKYKDQTIKDRDDEIERLKNQRSQLSTKLIGESLEQHCETEFKRWRATALVGGDTRIEFHKDNAVIEGHKGDYIYRETDADGVELVSIMFEMKNEEVDSDPRNRHTNESFFARLDKNRTTHHCEYAVLVSLLEPESDLYNQGIVDVSWQYPKMYVIRPQFFVPMITLLRNAALNALSARRELAEIRQQNIDVSQFESKFDEFKRGFGKNYETASKKFQTAIEEIDKTITHLEKVKANLVSSENQLRLANSKAQELTIRKLTYKNPTMKQKFEEARRLNAAREKDLPDAGGAGHADEDAEDGDGSTEA